MNPQPPVASRPAHQQALYLLRQELRQNWAVGDRLPPIKQLARKLGIGQTNAHRAARLLAREGILIAHTRRGTFLARKPARPSIRESPPAQPALRRALILRAPVAHTDPFLQPAVDAMTAQLQRHGLGIEFLEVDIRYRRVDPKIIEAHDALITLQPSGSVLLANDPQRPAVVLTTSEVEPMALAAGYDVVSADAEQGAMLAGQWMRRIDPADVAFVGVAAVKGLDQLEATSLKRLRAFEQGLGRRIDPTRHLLVDAYQSTLGSIVLQRYLAMTPRPAGLFCAADDLAVGFLYAAFAHGLRAGEDFQLIGFDGQQGGLHAPGGPLTTVRVPAPAMGRAAADLLLSRLNDPGLPVRRVLLACDFFEGQTALLRNRS